MNLNLKSILLLFASMLPLFAFAPAAWGSPLSPFSGLTASQSISYGTTAITLAGKLSGTGPVYPASGETITVTINGNAQTTTINDSTGDFSLSYNPHTIPASATPYTITYSYAGPTLAAGNNTSTALTVNKASLSVTASGQSKTYGQTLTFGAGSTSFTSSGLQNSETIGSVTLAVGSNAGAANAGVFLYPITPSAATGGTFNAANYSISYNPGTLTVNQAALSITASAQSKTYGQTLTFGSGNANFTSSGLQNSETIGSVTMGVIGNGAAGNATVGTYTLTPSSATGGTFSPANYNISYLTGTLTVNQAALSITASAQNKTYGQTLTFGSGSTQFTSSGLQNSEAIGSVTLAVSSSGGAATAAVGPYTITPSSATGGNFNAINYNITYLTGTLTVNQAALSITASPQSKTYGQTLTFGPSSTHFTSSGLQNSETVGSVTLTVSGNGGAANAAVGTYTITPSAAARTLPTIEPLGSLAPTGGTGGVAKPNFTQSGVFTAANYNITYNTGTLTVSPASTTTSVSSSANPALPSASLTFTATVSAGGPVPTGTVQFESNGNNLGSAVTVDGSGNAQDTITASSAGLGSDVITAVYVNTDGNFTGSTGTLSPNQTVDTPPSAVAQSITTAENTPTNIVLTATYAGTGTVTGWTITTPPTQGVLSGTAPNLTYTPSHNVTGSDSFAFTATDSFGETGSPATVSVAIINQLPVAGANNISRNNNTKTVKVLQSAILSNDSAPNNDPISITAAGNPTPAGATVAIADSFIVYTAPATNSGNGGFTYTLSDSASGQNVTGSVTVTQVVAPPSGGGGGTPNPAASTTSGGNNIQTFIGIPGNQYRIQYTINPTPAYTWNDLNPVAVFAAPANGVFTFVDTNPPPPARLYRAIPFP